MTICPCLVRQRRFIGWRGYNWRFIGFGSLPWLRLGIPFKAKKMNICWMLNVLFHSQPPLSFLLLGSKNIGWPSFLQAKEQKILFCENLPSSCRNISSYFSVSPTKRPTHVNKLPPAMFVFTSSTHRLKVASGVFTPFFFNKHREARITELVRKVC